MEPRQKPIAVLAKHYWLDAPNGRVTIGAWAVLIGRNPDCNIVLEQPEISRHHLLIRLGSDGVEMLPLGREPVSLNGIACTTLTSLRAGDRIGVGVWSFEVGEAEGESDARSRETAWCLECEAGLLHLITPPTYRVGGGTGDDLIVEDWEPTVFSISLRTGEPVLTALRPGVICGRELREGERVSLTHDTPITYRGASMRARARRAYAERSSPTQPPKEEVVLALEFLPRGGRFTIEVGGQLHEALLSERRCDLMACLLRPPTPFLAGDFIPEEVLCERIWPGEKNGRTELNSLLYRLRQCLSEVGIDPAPLFERRSGGLRLNLAPSARVVVR